MGSAVPEREIARVPLVVIGDPETDKNAGTVAATDVTVPPPVPAPIAVRKSAAFKDETVLSALKRGNVTADGLATVKRFAPSVVAPRLVLAAAAVVAPVPPLAIASVAERPAAVPVVFWFSVGMSAATTARNVGTPAVPFGAANTKLAVLEA